MKHIKIKTPTPTCSALVQQAMYDMGYNWHRNVTESGEYKFCHDCYGLIGREDGVIVRIALEGSYITPEESFEEEGGEEHYLINGRLLPMSYWTAPETTYEPLPEEPSAPTITPRVEFLRQRVSEILAAMLKFNEMKLVPPSEWHLELEDIFEEIKNAK